MYWLSTEVVVLIFKIAILPASYQDCPKEVTERGIRVSWHESQSASNVLSDPICYFEGEPITRNCNNSTWIPPLQDLPPCVKVIEYFDLSSCPPGYYKVSEQNNKYCYQIGTISSWDSPCLKNGGASVINDLSNEEYESLLRALNKTNWSKYFWLPALRRKLFNPVVWNIPGPNWGQVVIHDELQSFASMRKNCLMLDIEKKIITTESCSKEFPSLCIYLNDVKYPAKCPDGYYGFRFMSYNDTCFGIEHSENNTGLSFNDFLNSKCSKPMGDSVYSDLTKFLFMKMAELEQLPDNEWCWFATNPPANHSNKELTIRNNSNTVNAPWQNVINSNGTMGLVNASFTLPCMVCETEMTFCEETSLELEYNNEEMKLYLTIYFPSGLWKYNNDDNGVQCFSDAKGFVKPIEVNNIPWVEAAGLQEYKAFNLTETVEKTIFTIDPVTNRSAQYWCEGHNKTLSLLASTIIIANPRGNVLHVFAIVLKILTNESTPDITGLTTNLTLILNAEKTLLMDIFDYTIDYMLVLMHLHVAISNEFDDGTSNLQTTYQSIHDKAVKELTALNITFVNLTSCVYCLPTTSVDYIVLNWDLTSIGHIAAPRQFCLQSNGLPVKRKCYGSYLLGGIWGDVEGTCDETYEPSSTTTFLYNFAKAQFPDNFTTRFLTDGLGYVLDDVDVIIPADIYYLAMSLQHVINIAEINESSVDMGDIENMVWAMDRILILDKDYLRLAQTFNSTNMILDSLNDIIEKLARQAVNSSQKTTEDFQLCVKPQFIVQISYPTFNNITGIAVIKRTESVNFTDMIIQPLYKNSTVENVLSIENLEVATWIPNTVLTTLQKISNESENYPVDSKNVHIVITIYHNDAVFQQLDSTKNRINSRIVGITIPGFKSNLINPVPLLFKGIHHVSSGKKCGYWDFQAKNPGSNPGYWSGRGCFYAKSENNITVCQCYHMTNFGQLLDIGSLRRPNDSSRNNCHARALNIITLVGSFLSLFGICGIWLTALVFETWRKKPGTKVLLQLSTAIALPLIFMAVFNLDNTIFYQLDGKYVVSSNKKILCVILGALLQYSILASFMWMLITAILQFVRYVRVFGVRRPSRFMVKFTLIGWGIPLIPVAIILAVDYENYVPAPTIDPEKRICYPNGIYFILGIFIPIALVVFINVTLFLAVLYSISRGPEGKMRITDMNLVGTQLRLSLFLFFLLGLTWLFGILSFNSNFVWSYLFCLTSTLQGFVLFVYFVICDPATRNLWINLMKPQIVSSSRKSITSITSS